MKKIITLLSTAILPLCVIAQPTLHNHDYFMIGTQMKYYLCDTTGATPTAPGTSVTWDYSGLTIKDSETIWIEPNPSGSQFPAANYVWVAKTSSDTAYSYFTANSSTISFIGAYDAMSFSLVKYPNPQILAKNPFTYGDSYLDTFYRTSTYSGSPYNGIGYISSQADGYGTLITPAGSFSNVLRITTINDEIDTMSSTTFESYIKYTTWFDDTHTAALMQVDQVQFLPASSYTITRVMYLQNETDDVKSINKAATNYTGAFNDNTLVIHGNFKPNKQSQVFIYNMNGQKIYQSKFIPTSDVAAFDIQQDVPVGNYVIILAQQNEGAPVSFKVAKTH